MADVNADTIETLELSIDQAKAKIAKAEALDRLHENEDFKNIFLDGYLTSFAAEMVARKASPAGQAERNQKFIDGQICAIGNMQVYMQLIFQEGNVAADSLEADREELQRAHSEEE